MRPPHGETDPYNLVEVPRACCCAISAAMHSMTPVQSKENKEISKYSMKAECKRERRR